MNSLFGHLALKFGSHPEDLATHSLCFILGRSTAARAAFRGLVKGLGAELPENVTYDSQRVCGKDAARPDHVAVDGVARPSMFVEAKFWAGLTENQPVAYLEALRPGGLLLFVVPASRTNILWGELGRQCNKDVGTFVETVSHADGPRIAAVEDKRIALISWRGLLDVLTDHAKLSNDLGAAGDLEQLRGFCDQMDAEAFIPLAAEELTTHVYRRVVEFGRIVDLVTK